MTNVGVSDVSVTPTLLIFASIITYWYIMKMIRYWIIVLAGLIVLSDFLNGTGDISRSLMADLIPVVTVLWLLTSSFKEYAWVKRVMAVMTVASLMLLSFHVCCLAGIINVPGGKGCLMIVSLTDVVMMALLMYGFICYLHDVRSMMKNGTVWSQVSLMVDVVYVFFVLASSAIMQLGGTWLALLLLCGTLCGLCIRIMTDRTFLIWRKQERIIVESMKVTSVTAVPDESRIDDIYKDLYERLIAYFETEKPYLDGELTINDLVKRLYSNKLYISRTISQFTGRNFCQFVNYYRVIHSIECFRNNPELKVHELGAMSGFNTIVSYNMAFRLFMGENPSEWCRKEKSRLIKKKK